MIFNGGYGYDVTFAADIVKKNHPTVTPNVAPSTQIAQQLQPRFVGGNRPDLIDNSGAGSIGFNTIIDQLSTLDDVLAANNLEGAPISSTLYDGVKGPGTYNGKFLALNYVLTLYGVWYSQSLFDANSWTRRRRGTRPRTSAPRPRRRVSTSSSGARRRRRTTTRSPWTPPSRRAAPRCVSRWRTSTPKCWSQPAIQQVFAAMGECVKNGYFVPGGAGTEFTTRPSGATDQQALLYPSGSWIENEMKKATKADFKMTGIPEMVLTSSPKMPYESLRSAAGEPFIVPTAGKNVAGAKEILRTMLSKDAATNFCKTELVPTIVKGTVPADGFGSTALQSQSKMLDAAGKNVFDYKFVTRYGMNKKAHAGRVELVPVRADRRRRADERSAGHHRQGCC